MMCARLAAFVLLAGGVACGGSAPQPSTPATTPAPTSQATPEPGISAGASALLATYRLAAGGEALDRVQRLRATGLSYTGGSASNLRLVIQVASPGRYRQYEAPVDEKSDQVVLVVGLDGKAGWRMGSTTLAGQGMSADPSVRDRVITLAARQGYINAMAGILPLLLQSDPAIRMTALPPATSGPDQGAPVLSITSVDGAAGRLIFDRTTSLPSKFIAPYLKQIRAEGGEYTMTFSDFRVVDGIKLPFQITRTSAVSAEARWAFNAFAINPEFSATTFQQPGK